jgi:hypothetical protein
VPPYRRVLSLAAALLAALLFALDPSGAAAKPGLKLKAKGARAGGKKAAGIVLVDPSTGEVAAGAAPGKRSVRLDPASGVYMAVATSVVPTGKRAAARGGASGAFQWLEGGKEKLAIEIAELPDLVPSAAEARPASRHVPRGAVVTPGQIAAMGEVPLFITPLARTFHLEDILLTALFNRTQEKCGLRWVDRGRTFLEARQRELELQKLGLLDPTLPPIADALLEPDVVVEGEFELSDDGRDFSGELRLRDVLSGETLTSIAVEGRARRFWNGLGAALEQFACDICGEGDVPPTGPGVSVQIVGLPAGIDWQIVDALPPPGAPPRIDCPGTCEYDSPNDTLGISSLRVFPGVDPRTNDAPFDIVSMDGCVGTTALPATNGSCSLDSQSEEHHTVVVTLRYRPVLAVTYAGSSGAAPTINVNPLPGFPSDGAGFSCRPFDTTPHTCARHYPPAAPVLLRTFSHDGGAFDSELVSWDGPCAGQGIGPGMNDCNLVTLDVDTCITATWRKTPGALGDAVALPGQPCPTGAQTQ